MPPDDPSPEPLLPDSFEQELATHPHDAYFKRVFSDPAHTAALLRQHLPREISGAIAFDQLTLVPGSFVKHSLQQAHSDLLFRAPLGEGEVLLYILFEHQTSVDRAMPLRLLSYMTEIWLQCEEREGLPLPPILPFVLHQGPLRWTVSPEFGDLIHAPSAVAPGLAPYLPRFRYALLDLSQADPAADQTDTSVRTALQLMKLARSRQVLEFFRWLVAQTRPVPENLLRLSLLYALHTDENLDAETVGRILLPNPELQKTTMTLAQKLRLEGRVEGRAEGRNEGRNEGLQLGKERGLWLGKIQLMEEMLGVPATKADSLTVEQLEERFRALQAEYNLQFKKS